jgi:DNA-binding GntR family transcriptional regulator
MPIKKRENLRAKVYFELKNSILEFELKPGEKIQETKIAEALGVSRTPIREALNKLEQEGLIKIISNKGYYVSDVTSKEIEELYDVREALEIFAVRAAFKRATKEDWELLEKTLLDNNKYENIKDLERPKGVFFKDSHRFHEEMARISNNHTLQQIMDSISDKIYRLNWMHIFIDRSKKSNQEHLEIVEHLKKGHVEKAVEATREHIRNSKENILRLLDRKKNFFYID